jgi:hypothetical protein
MLINKNNHPILWCGGQDPEHRLYFKDVQLDKNNTNWMAHVDHEDKKIFYLEFFGQNAFKKYKFNDFASEELLEQVKNKEVHLLLHCSGHGYHYIPDEIYQDVILQYDIPVSQIILSTESVDMYDAVLEASKKYNLEPLYTEWTTEFEHKQMCYSNNHPNVQPFDLMNKEFNKSFLCMNGNFWFHRTATVYLLACYNLLDKGYVSLNIKNPDNNTETTFNHLLGVMRDEEVTSLLNKNKDVLLTLRTLEIDDCYKKGDNIAELLPEHNFFFNNSYFSLVTETNFPVMRFEYEVPETYDIKIGRLLSEKIFRTILYKHPFLVAACPNFLKVLKFLGYKTFEGIIDESYDTIENNATRLNKIVKEVHRIANFNNEERANFLMQVKDICEYNYQVLKNKNKFVYKLPLKF